MGIQAHTTFIYLLWLAAGESSFLQNIVEKIRPGCRNLQRSLIMVNLSDIILCPKSSRVCGFKNMGWQELLRYSIDMGAGKLLLVKCSQA